MPLITLYLPKMGESVMEAVVLHWCVREEEVVLEGAPLLEVATDKVDAEIPATYAGKIKKLLVAKGAVVAIGAPIALLEVDTVPPLTHEKLGLQPAAVAAMPPLHGAVSALPVPSCSNRPLSKPICGEEFLGEAQSPEYSGVFEEHRQASTPKLPFSNHFCKRSKVKLTPLAKHIAQEHGIQPDELERLASYAKDHRITKEVLLAYLNKRVPVNTADHHLFQVVPVAGDEVIQMDRVRKLIADRMVASKRIAPHVTSFIRADVTALVAWRNQHKASFEERYGVKLTYNPIFMAVIARALQQFPLLNAVVVDDRIIKRKHINMGFAVARADGNLLVPVVQRVEQLGLVSLAQQIDALIHKARSGTIMPDALTGASYTISNIGCFDNLMGTPIIVQPQVAILALGLIEKRPAVVCMDGKETIAIRDELFLSHTYDHRIIDGAIGGGFLKCLAKELGSFVEKIGEYSFT